MSAAHTPTPWIAEDNGHFWQINTANGLVADLVESTHMFDGTDAGEANAEFIVRACNSFDSLVDALRETLAVATRNEDGDFADRARDALLKAGADR
jgi:hypothetical protein